MKSKLRNLEKMALKAMMDPHFIFNILNSVQHFINAGDKESANQYLLEFSKLIRMYSGFSDQKAVLLEKEIEYLNLYLMLENLRFEEKFSYEIVVAAAVDPSRIMIPVMLIQPFLENAIWHGILPMKSNGHIVLSISREPGPYLKITVSDNGIGIQKEFTGFNLLEKEPVMAHSCIALQRLKLLKKLTGQKFNMQYRHLHPRKKFKGTVAEFTLPVELK